MNEINGLPAHILIVHFVVVGVPLAALLTVLSACWPAARRRLGIVTPIVAALALISVPVATNAGEWLQHHLMGFASNPLAQRHAELGDDLLVWVIGMFAAAALAWGLPVLGGRSGALEWLGGMPVRVVIAVLAVGFAAVSVVQTVRIGEAGSKATYTGIVCADPIGADGTCARPLGS